MQLSKCAAYRIGRSFIFPFSPFFEKRFVRWSYFRKGKNACFATASWSLTILSIVASEVIASKCGYFFIDGFQFVIWFSRYERGEANGCIQCVLPPNCKCELLRALNDNQIKSNDYSCERFLSIIAQLSYCIAYLHINLEVQMNILLILPLYSAYSLVDNYNRNSESKTIQIAKYIDNMCQKVKDVFVKKDILNHYQQYY